MAPRNRHRNLHFFCYLTDNEFNAFRRAGRVAGLDLSNWVRRELRIVARAQLTSAGKPVSFDEEEANP